MCLFPFKVPTRAKKIYPDEQPKVFNMIKCGWCCECQQNEKTEWMYRTKAEAEYTIKNNGWIIFDTLTYDEENCPWSKDILKTYHNIDIPDYLNFRCFNYRDVTLFMKRLRKEIVKISKYCHVKYFLSSEYGNDDRYTHRPHYHIIFFVTNSEILPVEFSKLISKHWNLGRTDGVKYKGQLYFNTNRLFKNTKTGVINAVGYVAKYINKDSEYSKIIKEKVSMIEKYIDRIETEKHDVIDTKFRENYNGRLRRLAIRRSLNQFHKQSHGYGVDALNTININEVMDTGKVIMEDSYVVKRSLTLPVYYYRKIFQYYEKDSKEWRFNELGRKYKSISLQRSVDNLLKSYEKKLLNANNSNEVNQNAKNIVYLLAGRKLRDYAYYNVVFKDRLLSDENIIYGINYLKSKQYNYVRRSDNGYNLDWFDDKNHTADKMVYRKNYEPITQQEFVKRRVITCNMSTRWNDYDKIDIEFEKINRYENKRMQQTYNYMCEQRKKMKKNGYIE